MDCSLPDSSVHGIFQARVLEWVAISFSRGSSWPRDGTQVSCIADRCFNLWATRVAHIPRAYCPPKPTDGAGGNLRISEMLERLVSGLSIGYLASIQLPQSPWPRLVGTPPPRPVEDVEVEKVTDQGDGGHSGPEGWPRPCQENLSLSQRSERAVCPVISIWTLFPSPYLYKFSR